MSAQSLRESLTVREAAALFCVRERTIRYHIQRGHLTYRMTASRLILLDLDSLNDLHQRLYQKPLPEKTSQVYLRVG